MTIEAIRKLAADTLILAYYDLWNTGKRHIRDKAEAWVISNSNVGSFSFIWCCEVVGVSYVAIRKGMLKNRPSRKNHSAYKKQLDI